ncbi:hypothetical protein M408DRAFT_18176 [Serendipita vermifera MAFF 305830]|uniref:C3H1-type domain-containing protein n=1 Tax=Serendipita vermifera MAFF 305830 TaxID=933852 RepID=A0A0C3AQW9_SERVB|nr:hypothetical protein M408DRAFT_18176 [Serendipita vermifera MAFF 305830]
MTPAGTRVAVRKDSINSPTTSTFASSSGATSASASAAASSTSTKGAQSDSGFFSKPKQKLPSFRKKPGTGAAATTSTGASAADGPPVAYSNPFEDAMKSLRKSNDSPANNAPNPVSSGNTIVGSTPTGTPGISSKTGKPKKKLRWDDAQLEKIKYIERAIYDDDIPGSSGFHGQSYRDLDRAEGNLLKHMVAQIEWFEPPRVTPRGESSKEANIQAEREMSALAAFYQGQPPDTPVEPPQLAALPPTADDAGVTTMLLGTQIDEMIQGGGVRPDTLMTAGHWLGQLGMEGMFPPQPQPPAPAPGQEGITDILNKLMKVVNQPEPGTFGASPYGNGAPPAGGYAQNPPAAAGIPNVDNAALMNALAALGVIPGSTPQQPPQNDGSSYGGGAYGGPGAAGGQPYGGGSAAMTSGLPPPLGMPSRDEQEDRWKRSAIKGDALNAAGKRGKRKDVPASQNTWKPLCTFFARGKCRFGEECDFSHDPSKLPK